MVSTCACAEPEQMSSPRTTAQSTHHTPLSPFFSDDCGPFEECDFDSLVQWMEQPEDTRDGGRRFKRDSWLPLIEAAKGGAGDPDNSRKPKDQPRGVNSEQRVTEAGHFEPVR